MGRKSKSNVQSVVANETAVLEAPSKSKKFTDMTPDEKATYYAKLKAKREEKKANRFQPPAGAPYVNEKGKYTFTTAPAEWNPKKQADFVEDDFASEDIWLDFKAGQLEARAASLRKEAEAVRTGGPRLKGDAKKLIAYQAKFEALKASLRAEGVDVDAVLALMNQPKPATA